MRFRITFAAALAGATFALAVPASALGADSFRGTCKLSGTVPAQPNGQLVQRGTCNGWLNGGSGPAFQWGLSRTTYRVKVVTTAKGVSGGPLPVVLSGPGSARFVGHGVTIPFRLEQVGLALVIHSAGSLPGYGHVTPAADGRSFRSRVEFPTALKG